MGRGGRSPPKNLWVGGGINKSQVIAINYDFLKLENEIFQQSREDALTNQIILQFRFDTPCKSLDLRFHCV